jgi:hypothetical protein
MLPAPYPVRFVASAARVRRPGLVVLLWVLALYAAAIGVGAFVPKETAGRLVGAVFTLSAFAYLGYLAWALRPRSLAIDVWPDRVVFDEGRGGVFPVAGALAGPWRTPGYGVSAGTALHLSDGSRAFCIGGRDHRPDPTLRMDAPVVQTVDAYLGADDFARLLAMLPPSWAAVNRVAPQAPLRSATPGYAVLCVPLVPNRASASATFSTILPWFAAMAFTVVVAGVFGALGVTDSLAGQFVAIALSLAAMIAGIVFTFVRSRRTPQAARILEIDSQMLRLLDAGTSAPVLASPLHLTRVAVGTKRYRGRGVVWDAAVIVITVPGSRRALTVGVPDMRFTWTGNDVRGVGAAEYVVGGADWLALVDRLGLRPRLVIGQG